MSASTWKQLASEKYFNLETYRRDGTPVRTPLWFAADPASGEFYISTPASSGKVKRMRRYPRARVAACDFSGNIKGEWLAAEARFCDGEEAKRAGRLLDRKYASRIFFNIAAFLFRRKRAFIVFRAAD
ncbi:MAG: PPOX class F420-dependent oxidoreductase [Acidobacteriales bacterium]|nr:PPOX class F420-dependent oxidoreductase [Terriglobales bacterium]